MLNTTVEGDFDLTSLSFSAKVAFRQCVFRGVCDLSESDFSKSLTLSGCRFECGLRMFGTRIGGQLLLDDVTVRGDGQDVSLEQLQVGGNLDAGGLKTEGRLTFRGAQI